MCLVIESYGEVSHLHGGNVWMHVYWGSNCVSVVGNEHDEEEGENEGETLIFTVRS